MPLTSKQIKYLRSQAQKRKAVVMVGHHGLSAAVYAELRSALAHHELLKLRLPAVEVARRRALVQALCAELDAQAVQSIGRIAVIYRRAESPRIHLPD